MSSVQFEQTVERIRRLQSVKTRYIADCASLYSARDCFQFEQYIRSNIGRQIGDFIVKTPGLVQFTRRPDFGRCAEEFEAECIVMSTSQFADMVRSFRNDMDSAVAKAAGAAAAEARVQTTKELSEKLVKNLLK